MSKKAPVKLSSVFAGELEQVELDDGRIVDVRPINGIGFDLYSQMEEDPGKNGRLIWEITAMCLPSLALDEVKKFTAAECAAVLAISTGRVRLVQELAREIEKNEGAPVTTAEHESPSSPILSDSSASTSPAPSAEI